MLKRLCAATLCCYAIGTAATLSLTPSQQTAGVGSTAKMNVGIGDVEDLFAYQYDLKFDPSVLQAFSVSEGDFLGTGGGTFFLPGSIDNVGGLITLTAATLDGLTGVSGSGSLASIEFRASALGSSQIQIQNVILLDSSLSGIDITVSGGEISVVSPEPSTAAVFALSGVAGWLWRLRRRSRRPCVPLTGK